MGPLVVATVLFHLGSSPTENNRYAKLLLAHDAVRLSYTIYFGDRPGAAERQRMDANRDGRLDDDESRAFAAGVVGELAPWVTLELDGKALSPTPWTVTDVGLGTPAVTAGSFSIDLGLTLPLAAGEHTLWIDDRWPVPEPGETEVRIEPAPGVEVTASHIRRDGQGVLLRYAFRGGPAAAGERGILVRFRVQGGPPTPSTSPAPAAHTSRSLLWIAAAAVGGTVMVIGGWAWKRRRRSIGRRTGSWTSSCPSPS